MSVKDFSAAKLLWEVFNAVQVKGEISAYQIETSEQAKSLGRVAGPQVEAIITPQIKPNERFAQTLSAVSSLYDEQWSELERFLGTRARPSNRLVERLGALGKTLSASPSPERKF